MSRRAKLLITTLFLVLLTIPMVYQFLSWKPENPLRFQVVSITPTSPPPDHPDCPFLLEFSVTNTAPTVMTLFYVCPALTYAALAPNWLGESGGMYKIPPGRTIRFKRPITAHERDHILAPDSMLVAYDTMSSAQILAADALIPVYAHWPRKYWDLIPRVDSSTWETPLQPATDQSQTITHHR